MSNPPQIYMKPGRFKFGGFTGKENNLPQDRKRKEGGGNFPRGGHQTWCNLGPNSPSPWNPSSPYLTNLTGLTQHSNLNPIPQLGASRFQSHPTFPLAALNRARATSRVHVQRHTP